MNSSDNIVLDFLLTERSINKINNLKATFQKFNLNIENTIREKYGNKYYDNERKIEKSELMIGFLNNGVYLYQYRFIKPIIDSPSLTFVRGMRTSEEYAIDLIVGWLIEDLIVKLLENKNLTIIPFGVDKERNFLSSRKGSKRVEVTADFVVKQSNKGFDIKSDLNGTWQTQQQIDIKEEGFNAIISKGIAIIGVDIMNRELFLLSKEFLKYANFESWKFINPRMDRKTMYGIPLNFAKKVNADELAEFLK